MARIKQMQTNFTSGVIAPITIGREDTAFYYNGLEDSKNGIILPSGGYRRRAGLQYVGKILRNLIAVSLGAAVLTAPQGGTAANVTDGNPATYLETTNNLSNTNPFVVLKVDFTAPVSVDAFDVINYKLSAGVLDNELRIQSSNDDATWADFGTAFNADVTDRSRRARAGLTVTARYWRIVRIGTTNIAGKVLVSGIAVYVQNADIAGSPRLIPFAYSTEEAYMMAVTDKNMDVFVGDDFTGSVAIPHTDTQTSILNWAQSLDTLALFHPAVMPQKIFRQGGDDEFDFRGYAFENVPKYDYGAGTGGVDAVQTLNVGGASGGGFFTILLEGERTNTITIDPNTATTAGNIQTALRALPNANATDVAVVYNGNGGYTVTFSGALGKRPWGLMSTSVMQGNAVFNPKHTTRGQYPGEDIMSNSRGWPRCGLFAQSRLLLGGLKGVPNSVLCSVLGEPLNFKTESEEDDPSLGLLFRPDSDQVGAVYQIAQGRHISVFSDDGESYFAGNVLSKDVALVPATQSGSKEGMRVFAVEGALLFVQGVKDDSDDREIGTSVQEFIYVDTEQNYQSNIVSKLSNHLIRNPIDAALIKGIRAEDPAILQLVNEDGTAAAFTVLRNELVNAFMPQDLSPRTNESFKAVGVDKRRRVYFVTERFIDGQWVQYLERYNDNLLLDCGGVVSIEAETATAVSNGQSVFGYDFTSPPSAAAVGVRLNGARLAADQYSVDLGNKEITLSADVAAEVLAGSEIRMSLMANEVVGLDHLEGETIQTYIDGSPGPSYTVSGGTITLNDYADTEIQYGFFFDVYGRLLPYRIPGAETLAGEKMRLIKTILSLYKTGHIEIRANGGRWQEVPLARYDTEVLDKSLDELLFTGERVMQGLKGHAVGGYLEFRQTIPAPLTIRSIVREVSL